MQIAIFGLGYVGSVSAACLVAAGHDVIGVDVDPHKLALIAQGRSPVTEPDLDDWLAAARHSGRLQVSDSPARAVAECDVSLICVGTPSRRNGSLDATYLERVLEQIGEALAHRPTYHVIALRSTVLPGVLESRLVPLIERASGKRVGADFGVCVNPEFLREGTAVADFQHPPFTIVGEWDSRAGDVLLQAYAHLGAPVRRVRPDEASMVKYASNAFHALKVAFANEIGVVSRQLGIDGREVMRIFCEDRDLNVSPRYLKPGFAFGGSCLPKDLRALNYLAREFDVMLPLLGTVIASNQTHIDRVVDAVLDSGRRRVALLGLSFKRGSDDLRESPFVALAEALIGKGVRLRICDPDVAVSQLVGRNRAYIEARLPHIAELLEPDWEAMVRDADLVIIGKRIADDTQLAAALACHPFVVDLAGIDAIAAATRPWTGVSVPAAVLS